MPNARWTIALSISTWRTADGRGTSIAGINRSVMNDVLDVLRPTLGANEVRLAVQNITNVDRNNNQCTIEYSYDGVQKGSEQRLIGDAQYLNEFVKRARGEAPSDKLLLWLISHSAATRQTITIPDDVTGAPKDIMVDVIVTSPVDRGKAPVVRPPPSAPPNAGFRPRVLPIRPPISLRLGAGVDTGLKLISSEIAEALEKSPVDVLFLQSCQTGGLDMLDHLAANGAAGHFIGSPANFPTPASEHKSWVSDLLQTPTMTELDLCKRVANAVVSRANAASVASTPGGPELDAHIFAAALDTFSSARSALGAFIAQLRPWIALNPANRAAFLAWLDAAESKPELVVERVRFDKLIEFGEALPDPVKSAAAALAAAHDATFKVIEAGAPEPTQRVRMTASLPNRAPASKNLGIFDSSGWDDLLRSINRIVL